MVTRPWQMRTHTYTQKEKRAETTNHLISDDDVLFHIKAAKTQKSSF